MSLKLQSVTFTVKMTQTVLNRDKAQCLLCVGVYSAVPDNLDLTYSEQNVMLKMSQF